MKTPSKRSKKPSPLLSAEDEEMRTLAEMEMEELQEHQAALEAELKSMLVPKDPARSAQRHHGDPCGHRRR